MTPFGEFIILWLPAALFVMTATYMAIHWLYYKITGRDPWAAR